jgi:hypothetical protein|nr:MAG TPA: hypothetical protein [Caudoviricetes sp.]
MTESERADKQNSLEEIGPKAFSLSGKAKTYIQGFLAGLETAERNREDKKDGENMGSISIPDKE